MSGRLQGLNERLAECKSRGVAIFCDPLLIIEIWNMTAHHPAELESLINALSEVMKRESIGPWLQSPNQAFEGLKPLEVIDRGEIDRIWSMIYHLRSGTPYYREESSRGYSTRPMRGTRGVSWRLAGACWEGS